MSRAKPEVERVALDFYATPDPLALAICSYLYDEVGCFRWIVEPSAGHGAFVRAARSVWPDAGILAVDVAPERLEALERAGATRVDIVDWPERAAAGWYYLGPTDPLLIVGNPPYRSAEEHVRAALASMREGDDLAFLLRINFLGSLDRVALWNDTPLVEVVPIAPRPSFTGGGTDGTEYAIFRWRKGYNGPAYLRRPLVWRKERAK